MKFHIYLAYGILVTFVRVNCEGPVVQLGHGGSVEGWTTKASDESRVDVFYNIPYADPPVGDKRWKEVGAHPGWDGVRNGTVKGPACWQVNGTADNLLQQFIEAQSEDCLQLNVYCPDLSKQPTENYAVMVWFHGGSFEWDWGGDPVFDSWELVKREVVVVTVNYRLGRLGFLSTADDAAKGNYGLLDQLQSLRWVRDHIEYFNGDPSRVTIFGESAGAGSCSLHTISPLAQDLFHYGIAQSGSAAAIWSHNPEPLKYAKRLANAVSCSDESNHQMIDCLRQKSAIEILTANFYEKDWILPFVPVVDGYYLEDEPLKVLASGKFPKKPFITGANKDEGVSLISGFADISWKDVNAQSLRDHVIPTLMKKGGFDDPSGILYESILMEYIDWDDPWNDNKAFMSGVECVSDVGILAPMDLEAQYRANNSADTYVYSFNYVSQLWPLGDLIPHAAELIFVFDLPNRDDVVFCFEHLGEEYCFNPQTLLTEKDRRFTNFLTTVWTNFAKYGDPTPGDGVESPSGRLVKWKKYSKKNGDYLEINYESEVKDTLCARASEYWNYHFYTIDSIANGPFLAEDDEDLWPVIWALVGIVGAVALACIIITIMIIVKLNKSKTSKSYSNYNLNHDAGKA